MNSTGQWFWYAGATLALIDIAAASRFEANPDPWVLAVGVSLMTAGLFIAFTHGVWDAWEQFNADERGDPA